jgi:uncharacterized membrane protein YoaT (DUF817 family)
MANGGWRRRLARWAAARGHGAAALREFVCFGLKQASACLFGGLMVVLLVASYRWYPAHAALARYDFLTIAALSIQAILLATRLESRDEALVIALFHVVGTAMELFKTSVGSWTYPEPSLLRLGGVPLFSGFMYASVGSYIARAWRLFDLRFSGHPSYAATLALAAAIYANFFAHHYVADARPLLFGATVILFRRTQVYFRICRAHRRMPLLVGFVLIALFIWLAENAGTFSRAWLYPAQQHGWSIVPPAKLGAWLLLMIVSYALVAGLHRHQLSRGPPRRAARRVPRMNGIPETATIGVLPNAPGRATPCSSRTCASPATTPSSPPRSPASASARRTTSS